jgi:hypothetical protein
MPGPTILACDFACGGDDNVILKRVGNRPTEIITWKDTNTASAIGKFNRELRRLGYESGRNVMVIGDATGPGRPMCDVLRESGIDIAFFNFGGKPTSEPSVYYNEGSRVWYAVAKKIRDSEIVAPPRHHPETAKLCAQLSSRRQKLSSSGKLWMETKPEMASRGVKSPDIADAFVMAFGTEAVTGYSYMPFDDSGRQEIASKHGWEYTSGASNYDESYADRRTWNRPPADDTPGFGGVHSIW